MTVTKIRLEGQAEISVTRIMCVCGCGNHDEENATIEFNFRDQAVYYTCSKCKTISSMKFGQTPPKPLPRTRM